MVEVIGRDSVCLSKFKQLLSNLVFRLEDWKSKIFDASLRLDYSPVAYDRKTKHASVLEV